MIPNILNVFSSDILLYLMIACFQPNFRPPIFIALTYVTLIHLNNEMPFPDNFAFLS